MYTLESGIKILKKKKMKNDSNALTDVKMNLKMMWKFLRGCRGLRLFQGLRSIPNSRVCISVWMLPQKLFKSSRLLVITYNSILEICIVHSEWNWFTCYLWSRCSYINFLSEMVESDKNPTSETQIKAQKEEKKIIVHSPRGKLEPQQQWKFCTCFHHCL